MKAIRIYEVGGPEVLKYEDVPIPKPGADEVLIKVHACGVNPIDWKIREGHANFPISLPLIAGWDASGEIVETGKNVNNIKKGDEVYGLITNGSYAEYIVAKADIISYKPISIDHYKAASVPVSGLAAWQALFDYGQLQHSQKVLIHAAAGGVGSYAVQFAKAKGATVIGTASKNDFDRLKMIGVDELIDYKNENFEEWVNDVDLVLDPIGGETQKRSLKVIKNGGRLITTVKLENQEESKAKNIAVKGISVTSHPSRLANELQLIAALIDSGKVKINVDKIMPLQRAAEAQQLGETGNAKGKIVLKIV
jgi:NADPH:quinone reductase-like Zn-dependent oxidoreductase